MSTPPWEFLALAQAVWPGVLVLACAVAAVSLLAGRNWTPRT